MGLGSGGGGCGGKWGRFALGGRGVFRVRMRVGGKRKVKKMKRVVVGGDGGGGGGWGEGLQQRRRRRREESVRGLF